MKTPKVTIAIPTYNRLTLLQRAVKSVQSQDYENIQVIISDNSSDDGTKQYLEGIQFKNTKILLNQNNIGMVGNWDQCLKFADGELFILLSDDDYFLTNDSIRKFVESYLKNPDSAFFFSCVAIESNGVVQQNQTLGGWTEVPYKNLVTDFFDNIISVFPCSSMFRTHDLLEIGGYGAFDAKLAVDACVWLGLGKRYSHALRINENLLCYKNHQSLTSSAVHIWDHDFKELERVLVGLSGNFNASDMARMRASFNRARNRIPLSYILKQVKYNDKYTFSKLCRDVFIYKRKLFLFSNLKFILRRIF